jgi:hypothetical protein
VTKKNNKIPLYETKGKLIEIYWMDAQAEEEWEYLSGLDKDGKKDPMYIKTVGYQLDKTENELIICRSLSSDAGLEGRFHIPLKCISKIKKIK